MNEEFELKSVPLCEKRKKGRTCEIIPQKRMMNNVLKMDTTTTRQKSTNNSGIMRRRFLNHILRGSKNSSNDDVFQLFVRRPDRPPRG